MNYENLNRKQKELLKILAQMGNGTKPYKLARAIGAEPGEVQRWLSNPQFLKIVYENSLKRIITCIPKLITELSEEINRSGKSSKKSRYLNAYNIKYFFKLAESVKDNISDVRIPERDEIIQIICDEHDRLVSENKLTSEESNKQT